MKRLGLVVGTILTPLALGTGTSFAQTLLNPQAIESGLL